MNLEGKVRLIPRAFVSAAYGLALDRALMKSLSEEVSIGRIPFPVVRVYQYKRPTVVLGFDQKFDSVDGRLAKKLGVDITRRDTGGGHLYFSG